ncbi:Disease resistance protein (NBS class) family [Raphanus sativus]|uniref:Probable disease resistance protein At5g45440 n=1 Tax=Raphanus sativus TaxID=3726 RepID=A0A6J0L519_RAPSA|nr:probable disease resistance protein At5g45440 [Raphanus sativus]KAJ4878149.1 Disease resistance protein (NBS class) family [Raphanus sativus]
MALDTSQHPDKRDFKERFLTKYNEWHQQAPQEKKQEVKEEEDRLETKPAPPKHEIYGFDNEIKSLENFLLDQKVYKEFKSLVIVGEYGVGKTALCQKIFNKEQVKSVYAPRIWVSMHSKDAREGEDKKISVLKRLLKDLGVGDEMFESIHEEAKQELSTEMERGGAGGETVEEKERSALLYALHLNLRWKKYLIVFDDVREEDKWDEKLDEKLKEDVKWGKHLSDGFPKGSGGRVIYTTRDKTVAEKLVAERHEIHRLWSLSDHKNVWDIYQAVVDEKGKEPPRNDKKCIDELMNKSRGLPLAVRLIAELDPVFLDDENVAAQDGSNNGTTEESHNPADQSNQSNP